MRCDGVSGAKSASISREPLSFFRTPREMLRVLHLRLRSPVSDVSTRLRTEQRLRCASIVLARIRLRVLAEPLALRNVH